MYVLRTFQAVSARNGLETIHPCPSSCARYPAARVCPGPTLVDYADPAIAPCDFVSPVASLSFQWDQSPDLARSGPSVLPGVPQNTLNPNLSFGACSVTSRTSRPIDEPLLSLLFDRLLLNWSLPCAMWRRNPAKRTKVTSQKKICLESMTLSTLFVL